MKDILFVHNVIIEEIFDNTVKCEFMKIINLLLKNPKDLLLIL